MLFSLCLLRRLCLCYEQKSTAASSFIQDAGVVTIQDSDEKNELEYALFEHTEVKHDVCA